MPVRLIKPYQGQPANTLWWDTEANEQVLRATNVADDQVELASDYGAAGQRTVTGTTANATRAAIMYNMNSSSAQSLSIPLSGYWPIGTVLTVVQLGTGATTVAAATGVTITQANGVTSLVTKGQNYIAQLIKNGANSWLAFGGFGG